MKRAPLFLAILVYATMLWSPCNSYYKWGSHLTMLEKVKYLAKELVMDAEMKIMAVQSYRDQYHKSLQYQLGDLVYGIRNLYKHMTRIYQIAHRDVHYGEGDYYKTVDALVETQRTAMHIETKVRMIQAWQYKRETKKQHRDRMLSPLRSGAPRDSDNSAEPLSEAGVRTRMERERGAGLHRAPAPSSAPRPAPRPNKKWRHVTENDFKI